jgi:hypothetical protein
MRLYTIVNKELERKLYFEGGVCSYQADKPVLSKVMWGGYNTRTMQLY